MKKILIISRNLNTRQSAPKCNYNIAISLAKLGVKVYIITSNVQNGMIDYLRKSGIKIFKVPLIYSKKELAPLLYTFSSRKYCRYLKIGNGYTLFDDVTWVHFPRKTAIKLMKNILSNERLRSLVLESLFEKQIFKTSKKLWAVSNLIAESLIKDYKIQRENVFTLYNGVNINYYKPLKNKERESLRESMNLEDKIVIIFVGGDPIRKGLYQLIKAIGLSSFKNKITILAIGFNPPSSIAKFTNKYEIDIRYLGKVSDEELLKYYQLSDIVASPSFFDPFSLAILEGMATGNIALVSRFVGSSEIIDEGVDGFIVDPNSIESIIDVINELPRMNLRYHRYKAREKAEKFSWDRIAKKLVVNLINR